MGVDHGRHGIGGIVKAIHKLKAERNQQCQPQQKERQIAGDRHIGLFNIADQIEASERQSGNQQNKEQRFTETAIFAVEIGATSG